VPSTSPSDRRVPDRDHYGSEAGPSETLPADATTAPDLGPACSGDIAPSVDGDRVDLAIAELLSELLDARSPDAVSTVSHWAPTLLAAGVCLAWGNNDFADGKRNEHDDLGTEEPVAAL
jgi:hypothetical protein